MVRAHNYISATSLQHPQLQPFDSTQSSFDLHHTYTPSSYPTRFVLCSFAHKMLPALLAARSGFISLALVSVHQCNSFNSQALGNTFAPCVAPAQRLYPLPAHMLFVVFFLSFPFLPKIPSFRKPPSSPPGEQLSSFRQSPQWINQPPSNVLQVHQRYVRSTTRLLHQLDARQENMRKQPQHFHHVFPRVSKTLPAYPRTHDAAHTHAARTYNRKSVRAFALPLHARPET